MRRHALVLSSLLALAVASPIPARAVQRFVRVFDEQNGLTISEVQSLAQDTRGFVWVGTVGGIFRFDGHEMRRWAPDSVRHVVQQMLPAPDGGLLVSANFEPLWSVTAE